jgi:uncharacterized membrane protein
MPAAFLEAKPLSRNKAIAFVFISAILWSTNGLFIKLIDLGPLTIVGVRSAIAAAMMIAIFNKNLRFHLSFPQLAGAVAYSAMVILFVSATKLTTAANVVFLHYTTPVFTALLGAWLLKERVSRLDWLVLVVVVGGMSLLFLGEFSPGGLWGNIMAIISAITVAFMILFLRLQKKRFHPGNCYYWQFVHSSCLRLLGIPGTAHSCKLVTITIHGHNSNRPLLCIILQRDQVFGCPGCSTNPNGRTIIKPNLGLFSDWRSAGSMGFNRWSNCSFCSNCQEYLPEPKNTEDDSMIKYQFKIRWLPWRYAHW